MSGKLVKENKCLSEIDLDFLKEEVKREVLELSFPIGKEYVTQEDINPATILGFGTWERLKGKVLVGLDEDNEYFNEIGKEGGETEHKLTVAELPSHSFSYVKTTVNFASAYDTTFTGNGANGVNYTNTNTNAVGGNQAHNNLQPYRVVGYMWIRTA